MNIGSVSLSEYVTNQGMPIWRRRTSRAETRKVIEQAEVVMQSFDADLFIMHFLNITNTKRVR